MKIIVLILLILPYLCLSSQDLPVVQNFNPVLYLGHWYLYSSLPSVFDFFCICTQTTYIKNPNNSSRIDFDEYCRVYSTYSPYVHSRSYAEYNPEEPAKWTNVMEIIGNLAVRGDYYIIGIGEKYEWALVGTRDRKLLYVLTREKNIDNIVYQKIIEIAHGLGFDITKIEKSKQICDDKKFLDLF